MKTSLIVFLTILVVSSIFILSIGAISGNLNLGIEFGLKNENTESESTGKPLMNKFAEKDNTETEPAGSSSGNIFVETNSDPETEVESEVPSQREATLYSNKSFWFKAIKLPDELKYAENQNLNSIKIDLDNMTAPYDPPIYSPSDDPIFTADDNVNIFENYSIPIVDPDIISGTGTIQYVTDNSIGDFYGIVSNGGGHYIPSNLPSEFEIDDLSIKFKVKQPEIQYPILYTWGIPVDVLEIEVLD